MSGEVYEEPVTPRELRDIRRGAVAGDGSWSSVAVFKLIAEIDRLAYVWHRGGPDDLITGEPASDGHVHTIVNGSHGCSCDDTWRPPPAESWTLPTEEGEEK